MDRDLAAHLIPVYVGAPINAFAGDEGDDDAESTMDPVDLRQHPRCLSLTFAVTVYAGGFTPEQEFTVDARIEQSVDQMAWVPATTLRRLVTLSTNAGIGKAGATLGLPTTHLGRYVRIVLFTDFFDPNAGQAQVAAMLLIGPPSNP